MPTISVNRDLLFQALGRTYTDDQFQELCFEFGLELDEVTTEKQMLQKEQGAGAGEGTSEEVLYRVDIPANRYDLLCLEGLVNGLLVFLGKQEVPRYRLARADDSQALHVTAATAQVRPYAVAAVLNDIVFDHHSYNSFIDLQEKLHQNLCRRRTLVAIGTHDLDKIRGPFLYDALPPHQIKFRALNQQTEMTAPQLMDLYSSHGQLKQYVGIIRDSPVYPVIKDRDGVVLSMPPIINGDHSKITLHTRNVFIECTATDLTKARVVLETLVCMFSEHCGGEAHRRVRACKVYAPDGSYELCPALAPRRRTISARTANNYIGVQESGASIAKLLGRMCLPAHVLQDDDTIEVEVPPLRHDVIHACDVYEDIAIAYGYNRIARRQCGAATAGAQTPLNKLTEQLRLECAHHGYTESLTFTLCSRDDVSTKLGLALDAVPAVHISNPKTLEFQVARTTLLPGLLKTVAANKRLPLPFKLFEVSDVVLRDPSAESGARNERRLCCVQVSRTAGFQLVHGLLDRVLLLLRAADCSLRPASHPTLFEGRSAEVMAGGRCVGWVGVLHPATLAAFELAHPASAFEINIEPFL